MFANGVGLAELQTKSLFLYQMLGSGSTAASFPNTIPQAVLEALQLRAHWEVEVQHFEDAARKQWLLHTTSQGSSLLICYTSRSLLQQHSRISCILSAFLTYVLTLCKLALTWRQQLSWEDRAGSRVALILASKVRLSKLPPNGSLWVSQAEFLSLRSWATKAV